MFEPTHALTAYDQTAIVYRPDTPLEFTTIARRPTPPADLLYPLEEGRPVAIRRSEDDAILQWWPDGLVKVIQTDGVMLYFWSKPTLHEAMDYRQWNGSQGPGLFKFNRDGSVYAKCFGTPCYWGPNRKEYTSEEGERLVGLQREDGTWDFETWEDERGNERGDERADDSDSYPYVACECRYK